MTSTLAVIGAADPSLITVGGLPLHPLAVHAVVVLLPLSVVGLIAIILVPKWRAHYKGLVIAGLIAGVAATIVAVQAGEQLAMITGISDDHRSIGKLLQYESILLLLVALWWVSLERTRAATAAKAKGVRDAAKSAPILGKGPQALAGLASLGLGVAALGLSALVGHSGATHVWTSKIAPAPTPTATATGSATGYTADVVKQHASTSDCWSIVDKNVYNLTDWINKHPGGPGVIQSLCGVDGSAAFNGKHTDQRAKDFLAGYKIGALSGTSSAPALINALTLAGVQTHNTPAACWSIVNGNVYNLTSWIGRHPGGPGVIQGMCGADATAAFVQRHGNGGEPSQALSSYLLGAVKP